jgi:hypothetical protein
MQPQNTKAFDDMQQESIFAFLCIIPKALLSVLNIESK